MNVETILQDKGTHVFTIRAQDRVADAVSVLNKHNVGALLVVDTNGEVIGILSERDIIRHLRGNAAVLLSQPVSDCMTPDPLTCTPESTVDELMQIMTEKRIRHMPVMQNRRLVGMISIGDVVKRKIEWTEEEAAALREYIAS